MPVYEVELEDGRIVELEADQEPSESDILAAIGSQSPTETEENPLDWLQPRDPLPEFNFPESESSFENLRPQLENMPMAGGLTAGQSFRLQNDPAYKSMLIQDPDTVWNNAFQEAIPTVNEMRALQPDIKKLGLLSPAAAILGALEPETSQPIVAGGVESLGALTAPGNLPYMLAPGAAGRVMFPAFAATTIPYGVAQAAQGAGTLSAGDPSGLKDLVAGGTTVAAMGAPLAVMARGRRAAPPPVPREALAPERTPNEPTPEIRVESAPEVATPEAVKAQAPSEAVARVADTDLQVSVQSPMKLGEKQVPGYVQVDSMVGGENQWSSNPKKLRDEGYDIPTQEQLQTLPQGKYSMAEAKQLLAEQQPAIPAAENPFNDPTTASLVPERAATPPPIPPQTPAQPRPEGASNPADLADIYRIFEPAPKTRTPVKERVTQAAEAFRTGLSSKFRPLNKLAEDVAKSYGRSNPKDIAGIMEQLKGSQGKGEAQIMRFDRDVSELVKGSEKDFNPYMFLRRTKDRLQQDAADIQRALAGEDVPKLNRRAVAGYTIPQTEALLSTLQAKLGPEKTAQFERAADAYQNYMDEALNLQLESGRMSQEVYDAIKQGNQFYAPFKVMKYLEETSRPEGSGAKIDTTADFTKAMTGIEDPNFKLGDMLGAARQSILISRILADKNMAMRNVAELAATDVEKRFIQKLQPGDRVPLGTEAVNVMEGGRTARYAVNPDVAQALQANGQTSNGILSRFLAAAAVPFRSGAVMFNIPFQVSNLLADTPRNALVSKYGVRQARDLIRYPMEYTESLFASMAANIARSPEQTIANPMDFAASFVDSTGKPTQPPLGKRSLYMDYLDSGAAGGTIQQYLTPEMLKFQEPTGISKSKKLAKTVLSTLPRFTQAIEEANKVLGVKRGIRFEGAASGADLGKRFPEAITEIRRFSGSPDFPRSGSWTEAARLNYLQMFFNARLQGTILDVGRLGGRDGSKTAAQTWAKLVGAVGIPSASLYVFNNLPEYKDDYEKRSKQEKDNYWLIPKDSFITTEDGEKMRDYWRIPKRESAKWIGNLTESAMSFSEKRDPKAFAQFGSQMMQELSPINIQGRNAQERIESAASGLNPAIKAPIELATRRDLYRHRPLIPESMENASPENQYTERTAAAFKVIAEKMPDIAPEFMRSPIMVENMTRNLTAGLFTQFLPRKPVEGRTGIENNPLMQRFQAIPYNDSTAFREEMQALERDAADAYLVRHRKAVKLLEDNKGKSLVEIVPLAEKDPRLIQNLADLWVAQQRGITPNERKIISLPAPQRAQWIISHLKDMTPEQKAAAIKNLANKRILTEAVVQEIGESLK